MSAHRLLRLLLAAFVPVIAVPLSAADGAVESEFAAGFFRQRVLPVFETACYECHGNGRHKGGLSMATRADFLAGGDEGIVLVPGDTVKSTLITAIRWEAHDADLNMPPKQKLPDAQIADLTRWVEMGAPWPLAQAATDPGTMAEPPPAVVAVRPPLLGRLHPVVVHFPLACLLLTLVAEGLALRFGERWRTVTGFLLVVSAATAVAAVITGTLLADDDSVALRRHQLLGWITAIGAVLVCPLLRLRNRLPLRLALLALAAMAILTGHLGGALVYGANWFSF